MRKIFAFLCALSFAAQFNPLSAQTAMNVWKNGSVTASIPTEDVDSVTFGARIYIINGHNFVDLGLPSGVLWAETNIGAETATDDGNYYAWGEITAKSSYSWSNYKYGTSSSDITKYKSTDGKTVLNKEDDAASATWGSSCRMPTLTEFVELKNSNNCTWTWTSMKDSSGSSIKGYKVTSKKNGSSIFLPASGYRYGSYLDSHGSQGNYWSSTLLTSDVSEAYCICFGSSNCYTINLFRHQGYTVRPVAEPLEKQ